jgi:hypothetical protein
MENMIFGKMPDVDEMISVLQELQEEINDIPGSAD